MDNSCRSFHSIDVVVNVAVVCLQYGWWENWVAAGKSLVYFYVYVSFSAATCCGFVLQLIWQLHLSIDLDDFCSHV